MHTPRQKRQSCEACRTRKLKCTGNGQSCARCASLGVVCTYQYMGIPGRPSKVRRQERARPAPPQSPAVLALSPPATEHGSDSLGDSADAIEVVGAADAVLDLGSLPLCLPDFTGTGDFGCIPLELLGRDGAGSPGQSQPRDSLRESCSCADDVARLIRTLRRRDMSHAMLSDLRGGAGLMGQLLACPKCYDLSKPPRLTIQNVLLIGRLMHQVTIGYRRHLRWVQDTWGGCAASSQCETVHIFPSPHAGRSCGGTDSTAVLSPVGIQVSSRMFRDLVVDGLRVDATRLTELASRFAVRQHNRHLVGHELCPDAQGRCWRERYDIDTDPLDICPRSAASRTLTPCFRIVDAVGAGIKMYVEEVSQASGPL